MFSDQIQKMAHTQDGVENSKLKKGFFEVFYFSVVESDV